MAWCSCHLALCRSPHANHKKNLNIHIASRWTVCAYRRVFTLLIAYIFVKSRERQRVDAACPCSNVKRCIMQRRAHVLLRSNPDTDTDTWIGTQRHKDTKTHNHRRRHNHMCNHIITTWVVSVSLPDRFCRGSSHVRETAVAAVGRVDC